MAEEQQNVEVPETTEETKEEIPPKPARKIGRAEKKMRDALLKHNLKELENVTTVTMRRGNQMVFTFTQPDVYYLDNVYIVFGESNMQDPARNIAQDISAIAKEEGEEKKAVVNEEGEVDETGVEAADIEMVMQQANVSRARAVQALKDNNNDMVSAVMSLSV